MTDQDALFEENRLVLSRLAARHDLSGIRGIEIGSRYRDWETAMMARSYIKKKYEIPRGMLFRVVSRKYSGEDTAIELAFDLEVVPDAELITKYELMLRDAAEKFGGETPGWEISPK